MVWPWKQAYLENRASRLRNEGRAYLAGLGLGFRGHKGGDLRVYYYRGVKQARTPSLGVIRSQCTA